jgi:tetratricopeptide (TPR) repeat protein
MALALACALALAYGGTLWGGAPGDFGFVFDDHKLVEENEAIRDLSRLPQIAAAAFKNEPVAARDHWIDPGYRPVRMVSYAVDYALWGPSARGFRLTNLLLHLCNALLVFSIARALASERAAWAAAFLFALHPLATEAVTYISGRRDVLFTLFYLAALRVFIAHRARPSRGGAVAIAALYALALGTKEMAVSLPLACLGVDLALDGPRGWRPRARLHATLIAMTLAAVYAIVFLKNPGSLHGESVARIGGSIGACAMTMARVFWMYVGLILFPATLSADYSFDAFPASSGLFEPMTTALAIAALAVVIALVVRAWRAGARVEAVLAALFVLSLGPVSQVLVPHPEPIAERYLYLPMIFAIMLAARVLERLPRPAFAGAMVLLLLACEARTIVRNRDWRDDETLFRAAAEAHPRCARAELAVGKALLATRPPRTQEALDPLDRCIEVLPEATWDSRAGGMLITALFERGTARTALGLWDGALADFARVVSARTESGEAVLDTPRYLHVRLNRGAALKGKGDLKSAAVEYAAVVSETAQILAPGGASDDAARDAADVARVEALVQLGAIALRREDAKEAIARLTEAAGPEPRPISERAWDLLGRAQMASGDAPAAERTFLRWADARLPSEKEAWYRVAEARDKQADEAGAKDALGRALAIDPKFGAAAYSLADIALKTGDLDEAQRWARVALEADPASRRTERLLTDIGLQRAAAAQEAKTKPDEPPPTPAPRRPGTPAERRAEAERMLALAEDAWRIDRPKAAARLLESATDVDPTFAPAWEDQGLLALAVGETRAARPLLRKALAIEPERLASLDALARAALVEGDPVEAEDAARRAIDASRRTSGGAGGRYAVLAAALDGQGKGEEAARARATGRAIAEVEAESEATRAARAFARFRFGAAAAHAARARAEMAALEVTTRTAAPAGGSR